MDELQKKKLDTAFEKIGVVVRAAAKQLDIIATESLKTSAKVAEAENALATVANYDLVHALRPVAREISAMFMQPNVDTYVDIFDQASRMILEGKDIPDVLCHFDMMLCDLKHGRK